MFLPYAHWKEKTVKTCASFSLSYYLFYLPLHTHTTLPHIFLGCTRSAHFAHCGTAVTHAPHAFPTPRTFTHTHRTLVCYHTAYRHYHTTTPPTPPAGAAPSRRTTYRGAPHASLQRIWFYTPPHTHRTPSCCFFHLWRCLFLLQAANIQRTLWRGCAFGEQQTYRRSSCL